MSPRYHCSRGSFYPRPPMTEARRNHIHGPLLPMERPEGEPSLAAGVFWTGLVIVVAGVLIAVFS